MMWRTVANRWLASTTPMTTAASSSDPSWIVSQTVVTPTTNVSVTAFCSASGIQ